jgi:hypothetical protein
MSLTAGFLHLFGVSSVSEREPALMLSASAVLQPLRGT